MPFPLRAPRPLAARLGRVALVTCAAASITACTSWHRTDAPVAGSPAQAWDHVRVTRPNGQHVELWSARLERDTLYGLAHPRWGRAVPPTIAVPADSIRSLEVRGVHAGRTTGLAAGVAGVGLAVVAVIVGSIVLFASMFQ